MFVSVFKKREINEPECVMGDCEDLCETDGKSEGERERGD